MEYAYVPTTTDEGWTEWAGRNLERRNGGVKIATDVTVAGEAVGFDADDITANDDGVYALRPSGTLDYYDQHQGLRERVWTPGSRDEKRDLRAIGVVGERIYVADGESGDLLVVSARLQRRIDTVAAGLYRPRELVTTERTTYALDAGPSEQSGRVVTVDRYGDAIEAVDGLEAPTDLAVDGAGQIYVLQNGQDGPVVEQFTEGESSPTGRIATFETAAGDTVTPSCLEVTDDGAIFITGSADGDTLGGLFRYDPGREVFERRRGFDRYCRALTVTSSQSVGDGDAFYAVVGSDREVFALAEVAQNCESDREPRHSAVAMTRLDSGANGTEWHRVSLDVDRPAAGTKVRVSYYATDRETDPPRGVATLDDIAESTLEHLRDAGVRGLWDLLEQDPADLASLVPGVTVDRAREWQDAAVRFLDDADGWESVRASDPNDALLDGAEGRYLAVRLELVGSVTESPHVTGFRAYCPRQSYLRYLPDLYRKDDESEAFLERFLSIFESVYVDIEEEIENVEQYFDPQGVPSEHLSWLSEWLAVDVGEEWPDEARRELLERAPELYKKRGTEAGMREMIGLYLSHVDDPSWTSVFEQEKERLTDRSDEAAQFRESRLDELRRELTAGHQLFFLEHHEVEQIQNERVREAYKSHMTGPQSFLVFAGPVASQEHREQVEAVVASQKPAHTNGAVIELEQGFSLEGDTFLGVNSTLSKGGFALGQSVLGSDTTLDERGSTS